MLPTRGDEASEIVLSQDMLEELARKIRGEEHTIHE